jgi:DNA-3-methyladenine glycosylase
MTTMVDLTCPDPCTVARELLGMVLTARSDEGEVSVRITEAEAYAGEADPASHAYRGRTARNQVMFGPAGHLYLYRSHGLHDCANVVCGPEGDASAVLLRAGEVVEGVEVAQGRRGPVPARRLASGPGNLASALGLSGEDNGVPVTGPRVTLHGDSVPDRLVSSGPRVGVRGAPDVPWRYWVTGDPTVSSYRRNPRAARAPSQVDSPQATR